MFVQEIKASIERSFIYNLLTVIVKRPRIIIVASLFTRDIREE